MAAAPAAGLTVHGVTLLSSPTATEPLSGHSRFVQRLRRRYASQLDLLPPGPPVRASMETTLATLRATGLDTGAALRSLRQLVMERLVVLDCDEQAPLQVVTRAVTELAEIALDAACSHAFAQLDSQHGAPLAPDGSRAQMWVVGMGKLGARELNVSSDIDLIYVYNFDGDTAGLVGMGEGRGRTSNHEYFCKAVKIIYALVGDTTEHGFVFRVDLALRPHGNSGPVAVSMDALENYLQEQGREWERFAWLKSRVVAPRDCILDASALRTVVLPFVFRRYLDYGVFDALRKLHQQIRDHSAKRSAGRPERANDVKLSRGGIREIEFTVQLLQVVRGGQFPELRTRPTLAALQRLARAGLMPQTTADALARAYTFLRQVEHRIQYLDDQQTHVLPTIDADLAWIAHSLGYPDCCAFLTELDTHRELVAQEFDTLLGGKKECKGCNGKGAKPGYGGPGDLSGAPDLAALAERLEEPLQGRLLRWSTHARVLALSDISSARLSRLVQRTMGWLQDGSTSLDGMLRWMDWIEPLLRRDHYLALLLERPSVHQRLLRLLATAKWPARYLQQHPGVIDELAAETMLAERFDPAALEAELEARRNSLRITQEDDEETLLNLLRRAHHAELFRTLARDVEGRITVEQVADDLSALADVVLRVTARWCWQRLPTHHLDEPRFAVIGYGKLGGKELGYGSDLDIVFVFEDEDERAPEVYAQLVRKLINWLSVKTAEGDLFEIDTALRPNGNSGMLVTTLNAYASYQEGRGSNTAWTWEHQAMTRARCVLGPDDMGQRFDAIRQNVITAPRDLPALQAEIVAMRNKVRAAHPVRGEAFDVKHSTGAMVDAEFAVQYLVLAHAAQHPALQDNVGNIALLQRAEACGLLPPGVGEAAANAYRVLRKVQHHARLNEAPTQVAPEPLQVERDAVLALWHAVFG
nr:bifunctional [glutamate--ammonia ligase]-adenylyl-L-tyrosine phosphorylase/[glutamate--ammonia-ligase] adenylyltransferase [uncultured Albidiferax sp.]